MPGVRVFIAFCSGQRTDVIQRVAEIAKRLRGKTHYQDNYGIRVIRSVPFMPSVSSPV
jgi:hypothetical protein